MSAWSDAVAALSPYLWWKVDETSGTSVADSSGNGLSGTYASATLNQTGLIPGDSGGKSVTLATTAGNISKGSGLSYPSVGVTYAQTYKSSTDFTSGRFFQGSSISTYLAFGSTNMTASVATGQSPTLAYDPSALCDGNAHFIVYVVRSTTVELWVDGTQVATGSHAASSATLTAFQVKQSSSNPTGSFDDVLIFASALSSTQIGDLYTAWTGTTPTVTASLAGTQQADVGAFDLSPIVDVSLAGTQQADVGDFTANVDAPTEVSLAGVERRESVEFTVAAEGIVELAGTEQRDEGAFAADVSKTLTIAGTERRDVAAFTLLIPPTATLAGVQRSDVGSFVLAKQNSTDLGRISGRTRGGYGVATWFPPVTPLPPSDIDGPKMLVAAAFGPQSMGGTNGTQPVYTISEAHTPRPRQQILVDGYDISGFRDTVTPDVNYQLQEPLLYGPGDLTLPQVACTEVFGTGDLWWLRPEADVIVNEVLDDVVVRTAYKGFINAFNIDGPHPTVELGGEAHGALEQMNRQVVTVPRVNDIGHQLAVDLDEAGIPHHPPLGMVTGIETLTTGGTGLLEHFHGVLAQGWTRAGRQWTVMPDADTGVYETHRKDDTTTHCTAFIDDVRTVLSVRRDISDEPNRVFGSGVTPRGMRVRNSIIPGLYQGPVPEFPGHMEVGDTGDGVRLLIGKLQAVNYLDLRDTPGGYDDDVAEAVVNLQIDAGFFEDGFTGTAVPGEVNLATWRALYDIDITGQSLAWARVLPMAQRSRVKEWRRSGTGGILGPNPGYDGRAKKIDRNIEFPAGLMRKQMFEFSKADLDAAAAPNWLGTITFHTGALLRGEVAIGAVVTEADVMAATEALPGHNLMLPNFQGGTLFHIAAAQVDADSIVTLTIDTRFRDAMEVWEVMGRNKDARNDPARRANQRHRSSTIVKDSIGEWFEHGGILGNDIKLDPGWNVFEVTAAMSGIIARLLLTVQTVTVDGETISIQGHEFVCALFGREITPARLKQIVPAPLTVDGKRAWRRQASRAALKAHWILCSFGTDEEPCGYGEDLKSDGATLTGVLDEDAGVPYRSESRAKLYVAVYVRDDVTDATVLGGRIMWPQLESGV